MLRKKKVSSDSIIKVVREYPTFQSIELINGYSVIGFKCTGVNIHDYSPEERLESIRKFHADLKELNYPIHWIIKREPINFSQLKEDYLKKIEQSYYVRNERTLTEIELLLDQLDYLQSDQSVENYYMLVFYKTQDDRIAILNWKSSEMSKVQLSLEQLKTLINDWFN